MRPVIGIVCMHCAPGRLVPPATPLYGSIPLSVLLEDITGAVEAAGGIAAGVVPTEDRESIPALLGRLDGILLQGGGDIDPALYGQPRSEKCGPGVPVQDVFEIALVRAALGMRKPVLGICRGAQVLNVATGGTLFQDLPEAGYPTHSLTDGGPAHTPRHPVTLTPEGGLRTLFGRAELSVNSMHHQAVKTVGADTVIAARAEDGVIEAVRVKGGHPFTYGVQWHPEFMPGTAVQEKLFAAFTEACRE